jgi:nucleotide-binding universal stress UspA family protein
MTTPPLARILVGVDLDDSSAAALSAAATLAERFKATMTVVHAHRFERPAYFTDAEMPVLEVEREDARSRCVTDVHAFVSRHVQTPVTVLVEEGTAADVIHRLAPQFDLVVVGTRRRHGPRRWWLGSVAELVLREAPVPVLTVPIDAARETTAAAERTSS